MYPVILAIHSLIRWLVLISLTYAIYRSHNGLKTNKSFSKFDNSVRHNTATIAHIQLIFGVWIYFISPLIAYFYSNFSDALHQREIRFFGMEHSVMMLSGIIILTIGSAKAKRQTNDLEKYKTILTWYSISLFVIITSIPWKFSPLISRPYFRFFHT